MSSTTSCGSTEGEHGRECSLFRQYGESVQRGQRGGELGQREQRERCRAAAAVAVARAAGDGAVHAHGQRAAARAAARAVRHGAARHRARRRAGRQARLVSLAAGAHASTSQPALNKVTRVSISLLCR